MSLSRHFPRSGFIEADDQSGHRLYYEEYGPRDATPWIMIHGNAGYIFDPQKLSMWDFSRQHVVILHARGVGRSEPAGDTRHNLYPDLAQDIETLRRHLGEEKVNLFGWSGGTAVALLYAETYSQNCGSLLLYGTYLGTDDEVRNYYERVAVRYPEGWLRFCEIYGTQDSVAAIAASNNAILTGDEEEKLRAVLRYELIFELQNVTERDLFVRHSSYDWSQITANRMIFAYMMTNHYGLLPEQIEHNLDRLTAMPITFVNGTADHVTPSDVAARLAAQLPKSSTHLIEQAGHEVHDPLVQDYLGRIFISGAAPRPSQPRPP